MSQPVCRRRIAASPEPATLRDDLAPEADTLADTSPQRIGTTRVRKSGQRRCVNGEQLPNTANNF